MHLAYTASILPTLKLVHYCAVEFSLIDICVDGLLSTLSSYQQQFMFVELTTMENELKKVHSDRPARSCVDIKLEEPYANSGTYTIDPNLGPSVDAIKTYCDFSLASSKTCVDNSTTDGQLNYLHLLHTHVAQTIQLPCTVDGPFRYCTMHESTLMIVMQLNSILLL